MKKKLLILAGDGIGPEVMNEVKKIIVWFNKNKSSDFDITEELAGGISFDKHGTPITDKVMDITDGIKNIVFIIIKCSRSFHMW